MTRPDSKGKVILAKARPEEEWTPETKAVCSSSVDRTKIKQGKEHPHLEAEKGKARPTAGQAPPHLNSQEAPDSPDMRAEAVGSQSFAQLLCT
jgi:hypothetical protein